MCLQISKVFSSKKKCLDYFKNPTIAKQEILVYKLLEFPDYSKSGALKSAISPYQCFRYERGFQYTESEFSELITHENNKHHLYVYQGLHAYADKNAAIKMQGTLLRLDNHLILVEMRIPRGAKYFLGTNDEIVTNKLIWY